MVYDPDRHHRRSIRLAEYDYSNSGGYFVTICTHSRACLFGEIVDEEMMLNDFGRIVDLCWRSIPEHFSNAILDNFVVMPNHVHGIIILEEEGPTPESDVRATPKSDVRATHASPIQEAHASAIQEAHASAINTVGMPPKSDVGATPKSDVGATHVGATHASPVPNSHASPVPNSHASPVPNSHASPRGPGHHSLGAIVGSFKSAATKHIRILSNQADILVWQRNYYEHIIRSDESLNRISQYISENPARWAYDRENLASVAPEPEDIWLHSPKKT